MTRRTDVTRSPEARRETIDRRHARRTVAALKGK